MVRGLIALCCLVLATSIWLGSWLVRQLALIESNPEAVDREGFERLIPLELPMTFTWIGLMGAAAVAWIVWQTKLCSSSTVDAHQLRRSSEWHGWSWFIPMLGLWYPYQNMGDLWRAVAGAERTTKMKVVLPLWWLTFLSGGVLSRLSDFPIKEDSPSLEQLRSAAVLSLWADGALMASGILAITMITSIFSATRRRQAETATERPGL